MKQSVGELPGAVDAFHKAMDLYRHEHYQKAQALFKDIVLNYPGSAVIDSAQFYLGMAQFQQENWIGAGDEFRKLVEQYPSSTLGGDAEYFQALCDYRQAPSYQLDQDLTNKAIQGFQRFLEEHPGHALTDSAYHYVGLSREKLAHKEYSAASLYVDLEEYASAILYADVVLSNYYDTDWAGPAQFVKARSYYQLKDWERAKRELQAYLDKYGSGKFAVRAREMLVACEQRLPEADAKPAPK
jgi:outer membrane protein assembly factor BamD